MKKLFVTLLVFLGNFMQALAAPTVIPSDPNNKEYGGLVKKFQSGGFELSDIPLYIKYLTENLVWLASSLALIMIIFAGYKYVAAAYIDDESQAKTLLKNIFIGMAVVVFSWMIVDLVVRFLTD